MAIRMTPSKRAQQGGLTVVKMVDLLSTPRQTLYDTFNRDPIRFDELLIKAMRAKCEQDVLKLNQTMVKPLAKESEA